MTRQSPAIRRPASLRPATSRKTGSQKAMLALGASALLLGGQAMAQDASEEGTLELDTLRIEERTLDTNPYAEDGVPYKARISGDSRRTETIAETPATISVVTQTAMQEAGTTDLRETLDRQPGITLGTGENGNAFGDRYVIRGHEARSDVFVDGLRDPGMTIRESFAVEQIEITKGPSSTFAGRGSTGGAINSITKQAGLEYDFNNFELGIGTDGYRRFTLDSNMPLSDTVALRANLLHAYEEVPDRGPAERERNGAALSLAIEASDTLSFVADYYFLDASGDTDLGTYILPGGGAPVDDIPVYLQSEDFLESTVNVFTFRTSWEPTANLRIENALRYGTTDNGYVVTGARGTDRDASDPDAPGAPTIGLSTHQGWQEVEYFVDQANAFWDTQLAGLSHSFVFGLEYSDLSVTNGAYDITNTGATNCVTSGRGGAAPNYCILDANGDTVANLGTLMGRDISRGAQDSDYNVDTLSLYAMDTVDLTDQLSLFAGVRLDSFDYTNGVTRGGTTTPYDYSDDLWNGHIGLVYDVTDDANIYLSLSTSSNINGGESDVGGSCGYGGLCGTPDQVVLSEPEDTLNIELGSKWSFYDDQLLFTVAAFQITKSNVMESVGSDYEVLGTLNTGENQVTGIEFGLVGNITDEFSVQFGAAFMSSEVTESVNTAQIGGTLSNFADNSAYLQLRYQATPQLSFGGAVTYSSEMYSGQPDSAGGSYEIPAYTVLDAFATWEFTEQTSVRLNVGNLTDENYYTAAYRSGAFTYIGDARNVRLTLVSSF
ncbi:TonB-dependent receptor [Maricaulis sp.]|uniref:TonB-dependent receptor n=1 Tax=Maricaulis sp. TaxID=1486257 RepID=UPI003A8D18BA